jgi:hypothetical protein
MSPVHQKVSDQPANLI